MLVSVFFRLTRSCRILSHKNSPIVSVPRWSRLSKASKIIGWFKTSPREKSLGAKKNKQKQDKNEQTKRSGIQQIKCHKGYSHFHKSVLVYSRLTSQRSVPCIRANGSALRGFAHTSVGKGQDWPIIAMNVTTSNATPSILARFSNLCIYMLYIYIWISKKQNRILIMPEYHVQQPVLGKRKSQ